MPLHDSMNVATFVRSDTKVFVQLYNQETKRVWFSSPGCNPTGYIPLGDFGRDVWAVWRTHDLDELHELLITKYGALPVSRSEFASFIEANGGIDDESSHQARFFQLLKIVNDDESLLPFIQWLERGLLRHRNGYEYLLKQPDQKIWNEYCSNQYSYYLQKEYEYEENFFNGLAVHIEKTLTQDNFEKWLVRQPDRRVIGNGHKPGKSVVIRFLKESCAWNDALFVEDSLTAMPGRFNKFSSLYSGIPLSVVWRSSPKTLFTGRTNVPIPTLINHFISANLESRADSRFAEHELYTALKAKKIWKEITDDFAH